jgi:triacylglycerol lipase
MQRIYTKLTTVISNGYYWFLDYVYVVYWQIRGLLRPADLHLYADKNRHAKTAIILLPGIYENWQFMKPVADMLFEHDENVHIVDGLGYNRGAVEAMAKLAYEYITENNITQCIIVAHSKGGLIGKYMMMNFDEKNIIKGMVSINTPFSGSTYAYLFFPFRSLRVFTPKSQLLLQLAVNQEINKKIVSIYGTFDPHIPKGSYLVDACNIQLTMKGHFRILASRAVQEEILTSIDKLSQ